MTFTSPLRLTVSGQIQTQLREAIARGDYAGGKPLPSERELVGLFGASRVAVREALVALQAEGVIERSHGRAARVLPPAVPSMQRMAALGESPAASAQVILLPDLPSEANVRDVKQARMFLEVEMVRLAASSVDAAGSETLRAALQANRDAISNSTAFLATDMALHSAIAAISGNALFVAMSREMLAWLSRLRTDVVHLEGSDMLSHREHARIVDLIVARDADGAARAMVEHLSRSHQAYGRLPGRHAHSLLQPPADTREDALAAVRPRGRSGSR